MGSIIQKYKKLRRKVDELEYNKMCTLVDLDIAVNSRKNLLSARSQFISKNHFETTNKYSKSIKEIESMVKNRGSQISIYLQDVKRMKKKIAEANKELSNLCHESGTK